jgi:hypothetical protein
MSRSINDKFGFILKRPFSHIRRLLAVRLSGTSYGDFTCLLGAAAKIADSFPRCRSSFALNRSLF